MNSELIQNTPEWYKFRRLKIGASDAPIIMEVSPWKTPYQLWLEKTTGALPPIAPQQRRGLDLEERARSAFEKKTGRVMFPKVVFHPSFDWMMASLDGIDVDGSSIVEIKCPGQVDHAEAKTGRIPKKYFPQLQHQLAVTGLEMVSYFSFDGNEGVIVEIGKDEHFIAKMIDLEKEFWKCVTTLTAPPLKERDIVNREDPEWVELSKKWLELHQKIQIT